MVSFKTPAAAVLLSATVATPGLGGFGAPGFAATQHWISAQHAPRRCLL
jgi:hypothetical protein